MSARYTRLVAAWLLLALGVGLGAGGDHPFRADAATTFPMQPSDTLLGGPRGDVATVVRFAEAAGSGRIAETRAYIAEIYRLAPQVGLDPAILIAQSALETGYWRTAYWHNHLNPAGIGIYSDGAPSFTWRTGADAARGQIYHLYCYAAGVPRQGHLLYQYRHLTPGTGGIVSLGYAGTTHTIAQLTGRWALDPIYAQKLVTKGNEIFGSWRQSAPTPTPTVSANTVAGSTASDGNDPRRAHDGNLSTTWALLGRGTPPTGGHVTFDLGAPTTLSSVRWVFRLSGYADHLRIRTSLDGRTFTTIKFTGNAPAKVWQTLSTTATARYVRFHFLNPNNDPDLGYLAEVAFSGKPATATPTPTATMTPTPSPTADTSLAPQPTLSGAALTPVGSGGSSGVTPTSRVRDGNLATDWRTTTVPPPGSAFVYLDLGGQAALTGARWFLKEAGCGGSLVIAGSDDKRSWRTYAAGSPTPAGAWMAVAFDGVNRYVRFQFLTPGGAPALGCLAEAEVWGMGVSAAAETPAPTATLTPTATATASTAPTSTPESVPTETATATVPVAVPTEPPIPTEPMPTTPPEPTATSEVPTVAPDPPEPTEPPEPPTEAPDFPPLAPTEPAPGA